MHEALPAEQRAEEHAAPCEPPRRELVRLAGNQLRNLLAVIDLLDEDQPAQPDGLAAAARKVGALPARTLCQGRGRAGPRGRDRKRLRAFWHQEPRLLMVGRLLHALREACTVTGEGQRLGFDGFRLRNLGYWARYSHPSALDSFGELSSYCGCDCEFCYLKGTPSASFSTGILSMHEAETRARYWDTKRRCGLPTEWSWSAEPLVNPDAPDILRLARDLHSDELLDLTTNGDRLTGETVAMLATLKPIIVIVSLNSADPVQRGRVMRNRRPETAIQAIPMLREHGVPIVGSIVPWPSLQPDDIEATIRFLDEHDAFLIRLALPGYTRFRDARDHFETSEVWDRTVALVKRLRKELSTPIHMAPSFFWRHDVLPYVDGVHRGSPAERAGLRADDLILAVNGRRVFSRPETIAALKKEDSEDQLTKVTLTVRRGRDEMDVGLEEIGDLDSDHYPYKPRGYPPPWSSAKLSAFGLFFIDGFCHEYLRLVRQCLERRPQAQRILLFTTPLVKPHLLKCLALSARAPELSLPADREIRLTSAPQRFWGGNIMIGDLQPVQDYIAHLETLRDHGYVPDLVLIPGSFTNRWGQDILGSTYLRIERESGVAVELLPISPIMF